MFKRRNRPAAAPHSRVHLALEALEDRRLLSGDFVQTNLVSDVAGLAEFQDKQLINPWGLVSSPANPPANLGTPWWVSDQGTGLSTLYNGLGVKQGLVVTIPPAASPPHGPTGIVFNTSGTGFNVSETVGGTTKTGPSVFLFDALDGTIDGWSPGVDRNNAIIAVNNNGTAIYTGLAIGVDAAGQTLLYAANNKGSGSIDVYDQNFKKVTTLAGSFQGPDLPANAAPFNIQDINNQLYVEYTEGPAGAGHGAVAIFSTDGKLVKTLINGDRHLNSPWGIALAPSNFGKFSGDLFVGNFGDGHINVYRPFAGKPTDGKFVAQLTVTTTGQPFEEDHLWSLQFGNGGNSGPKNTLFFTAGINNQKDGLFGTLQPVPRLARTAPLLPALGPINQQTNSTVPTTNRDLNPYGVAFVPNDVQGGGVLQPGDLLVSNFNNAANVQGTGSTIVRFTPAGGRTVFFNGIPGQQTGLTTALGVLKSGFVLVGNVPTDANGVAQQGSLIVLDSNGKVVTQLTDSALLDGPWDLAINDMGSQAQVFVSDVLSGTVTRIDLNIPKGGTPQVESETQIASGYAHRLDPNVVVLGPTGLAFDPQRDVLYVASTLDNKVFAIPNAALTRHDQGTGTVVFDDPTHLHGPLGLVLLPNGDLVAANGDAVNPDPAHPNELVEFRPRGNPADRFVAQFQLDPGAPWAPFGVAVTTQNCDLRFAAVDDDTNTVNVWTFQQTKLFPSGGDHDADDVFVRALEGLRHRSDHGEAD